MALEAVVVSQQQGSRFGCGAMAGAAGGAWNGPFGGVEGVMELGGGCWDAGVACSSTMLLHGFQELDHIPAAGALPMEPVGSAGGVGQEAPAAAVRVTATAPAGRRKRRRTRVVKNREEVESQRMTHIAVERNRRKQMNEYLAVLRSLMPPAYAQRGDQASIVGGAINFVKELEQLIQCLEAQKQSRQRPADGSGDASPFADFFTFPQYSMSAAAAPPVAPADATNRDGAEVEAEASGSKPSAVADVEVTMVESHANLRVLSRRRQRQLLRLVVGLQGHRLTVLHLNMTSAGHMVLYSFSLKVEDDCQLTSVDEIATAAHQIVEKIQEEQGCSSLD
ncbi:transcription factor bHLH94-like [Phragmites australis]|uniref:transcription factor bHLH94-like n=1 Tax=Phragmites australis TaxID=29695 RepID=UPI002D775289|nr:transcription factor bHLH94-like [Phragmites australis]